MGNVAREVKEMNNPLQTKRMKKMKDWIRSLVLP